MRIWILLLACTPLLAQQGQEAASTEISVQSVTGDADVQPAPDAQWQPAAPGLKLGVGARVSTGAGSEVVVSFGRTGVSVLGETAMLRIDDCSMQGGRLVVRVFIDPGVVHATVKQLVQYRTDFQVSTPRLTCSVKGSGMRVEANGDQVRDKVTCEQDAAMARKMRVWLARLDEGESVDDMRRSNLAIEEREQASFRVSYHDIMRDAPDDELTTEQLDALSGSIGVTVSDLNGDHTNPKRLVPPETIERTNPPPPRFR